MDSGPPGRSSQAHYLHGMPASSTTVSRSIAAPRAVVYRALIDPQLLVRWRFPEGMRAEVHAFDAREGGAYRMSLTYTEPGDEGLGKSTSNTDTFEGRFAEVVENERVVELIRFSSPDPRFSGEMRMTTDLTDAAGGTTVTIRCDGIPAGIKPSDNEDGSRMALDNLARLMERG